ncbi:MAG: acetoin utilization protein AcuC [endosymbiont of Galathealinum brachiosum]|uniref:Acetoin utilization protein AcuC n=1 Tax=endosymbiont of Galathealinum brachiosum TaxID=2200906 RepID=A0A370D944_9GAMM|nr:MAG: acetoin utilization protein AcuC [endosymbiont of Galathealinum brachiosum]
MKTKLCLVLSDQLAEYHFGEDHPFGPKRYWEFKEEFERREFSDKVSLCAGQIATIEQLELFHTELYVQKVIERSISGEGYLDAGDTPARRGIYDAACVVVGSVLSAVDNIVSEKCNHAFIPIAGLHHATRGSAAGFCVFNDCGIAIEYLRHQYNVLRIAYVDIDAHHGDGVFYSFEDDADLCCVDFHQDGSTLYPGTGSILETGTGNAKGTKLNIPLAPYTTDETATALWEKAETFISKFNPDFILFQCGADSLAGDPITQLDLTSDFHAFVAKRLSLLADRVCKGRILAMGGGGYNLKNIQAAWNDVIESLC